MTISAAQLKPSSLHPGRPTRFTPERIQQICNLVERGKSREEIAEIIGVTSGTLQLACSKLGVSLRRPTFDRGTGLLPRQQPGYPKNGFPRQSSSEQEGSKFQCAKGPQSAPEQPPSRQAQAEAPCEGGKLNHEDPAVFAIRMEYKGQERLTGLPLDEEMISQLAMEAEIRGMRMGELVAALILEIVKKDLFKLISDDNACFLPKATKGSPPSGTEDPSA
jgi:hypothetical protein